MRFGIKDICIVSFIGVLTGCYMIRICKRILEGIPFVHYLMGALGIIAVLSIVLIIRPLLKQESPD